MKNKMEQKTCTRMPKIRRIKKVNQNNTWKRRIKEKMDRIHKWTFSYQWRNREKHYIEVRTKECAIGEKVENIWKNGQRKK